MSPLVSTWKFTKQSYSYERHWGAEEMAGSGVSAV